MWVLQSLGSVGSWFYKQLVLFFFSLSQVVPDMALSILLRLPIVLSTCTMYVSSGSSVTPSILGFLFVVSVCGHQSRSVVGCLVPLVHVVKIVDVDFS